MANEEKPLMDTQPTVHDESNFRPPDAADNVASVTSEDDSRPLGASDGARTGVLERAVGALDAMNHPESSVLEEPTEPSGVANGNVPVNLANNKRYYITKDNLDTYVKIEEGDGSTETRYILDFGFFLKKSTKVKEGKSVKEWDINTNRLKDIRDHWDPKIQSHLLVYMFTQTICATANVFKMNYVQYLVMVIFTFFAGSLAYLVRWPTERALFGSMDMNGAMISLSVCLAIIILLEFWEYHMTGNGYFQWTNFFQVLLIFQCIAYLLIIPWESYLSVTNTKKVMEILESTNLAMNVTHDMVWQEQPCSFLKTLNYSNFSSTVGKAKFMQESMQTEIVANFISDLTLDAIGNFEDVESNITDVSYYLMYISHDKFLIDNDTIRLEYTFNLTFPNGTHADYHNHQFLIDIEKTLRTTKKEIGKSLAILEEILELVDLDTVHSTHYDEYKICMRRITKILFNYQVMFKKLTNAVKAFDDVEVIYTFFNKYFFLHFSVWVIFWMALVSFSLVGRSKTTGIYTIMLRKLFIKTIAMLLFFMTLISAFANALRLLIDHRESQFRPALGAVNKVLAMMTGELEYSDTFQPGPGESDTSATVKQITFAFFTLVMVILSCNFLIAITMDDLNKIRRNAVSNQCKNILFGVLSKNSDGETEGVSDIQKLVNKYFPEVDEPQCLACFHLCLEKNSENKFINFVLRMLHNIQMESNKMSLWVCNKKTGEKGRRFKGGFLSIDTVSEVMGDKKGYETIQFSPRSQEP